MSKATVARFLVLLLGAHFASTSAIAETDRDRGYRDCTQRNLAACQDSNQLIWGPGFSPRRKTGFDKSLNDFLRGAPKEHLLTYSFTAASIARESLTGPGDPPFRLSGGEWFFWGFTPHDAPDMAAIVFDSAGRIVLVGTLRDGDATEIPVSAGRSVLTIYIHQPEPSADVVQYVQRWARHAADGRKTYTGQPRTLVGTRALTLAQSHWQKRWIADQAPE
jgi:hypothetical protein